MSDRSAAIGLASASSGCPPPNSSACALADERPGHGLDHAARARARAWPCGCAPAAASAPACARRRRAGTASTARGRRRRCARPPRRCRPCLRRPAATTGSRPSRSRPGRRRRSRDGSSTRFISTSGTSRPERRFTSATGKSMMRSSGMRRARDRDLGRLAAAEVEHHLRRELEPRHHEGRIDAALEAVARVRIDAELAAGLRDVERRPQRRLDQHVGGVLVAARRLAAHDAGERLHGRCRRRSRTSSSSSW